jgi:8-oxo-dGTP pyrophosphatase MutT (NUDIX family)
LKRFHQVINRKFYPISPWLEIFETEISTPTGIQLWHTIKPPDYITALVETKCGKIALVQQLRAVGASITTEFPGGLLESGETPEDCIVREIREEVGLEVGKLEFLAKMIPDTGRLENHLYAFYAGECKFTQDFIPESGVLPLYLDKSDFWNLVKQGKLVSAINIAILGHAVFQGFFNFSN